MKIAQLTHFHKAIARSLMIGSISSVVLYLCGLILYGDSTFWFLLWNLFLAWLPLLFAWLLAEQPLRTKTLSLKAVAYFLLWLGFLPNSFYIVSDFVHMRYTSGSMAFFNSFLIMSFAINGLLLGYISVALIHRKLQKLVGSAPAHWLITGVFMLCSFAIYLGRVERWNTWDILINPAGLLFDVSDPLINPLVREEVLRIMVVIFITIATPYAMAWQLQKAARTPRG